MRGQTVILRGHDQRALAKRLIDAAPADAVVNIQESRRTLDQNAKLWAMLSDVSRAKPDGRRHTAEVWKALFMQACGHETQFETGLDGRPFPTGHKSSQLTVKEMSDLIEFIYAWGSERGVAWSEKIYEPSGGTVPTQASPDEGRGVADAPHGPASTLSAAADQPDGGAVSSHPLPSGASYETMSKGR